MDYTQQGFNDFLTREVSPGSSQELDPLQSELYSQEVSGSKVQGGILQTLDEKTKLNLEQGFFSVNDGSTELIRLGLQEDGTIGFLLKDRSGNTLIRFVGDSNVIRSPNGNLELNFDNTQLLVKDDGGLVKVLIGKDVGGF